MNRHLLRFVACLLVPSVIGADPSWAIGLTSAMSSHSSTLHPVNFAMFDAEAVVQPLDAGFDGSMAAIEEREAAAEELRLPARRGMNRRRALFGIGILFAAPTAVLAQQTKSKNQELPPVVKRTEVPQAAAVERQNRILTDAQWEDAWHEKDDSTDPRPLKNQLRVVTNNSPKVGQMFYKHREAWESFLAIRLDDGKYSTNRPDQLHALGVGTSQSTISQALSYPGVSATQPKRQVETADFEPVDKSHPGFLHWRTLAQYAVRGLKVLEGIQLYSLNQVEMSFLQEHAKAFEVREAYADLEEAAHDGHVAAVQAWLDYTNQAQKPAELREAAWIEARARDREKIAAPREGRPLTEWFRLQGTSQQAVRDYDASFNDQEPLRIHWSGTIGHTENDLSREASTTLHPQGSPVWPTTRELFNLADAVAPLIAKEQAAKNVVVREADPLPPIDEWDASRPSLPDGSYAPDSFLKFDGAAEERSDVDETTASELESLFTATAVDAPLGTSPHQRWLQLQKEMIETVQAEMLELQKLPTWNVGLHVDLGTMPFIAALLNWDYRRPGRSKILSLGDLQVELGLRAQEIDVEVIGDRKQIRNLWLAARTRRQISLAKLIDVRNEIVTYQTQRTAAVSILQNGQGKTSADPVTPALHIEQLKKEYARHLTEAWAAWQMMQLYTVEGQERVVAETFAHNSRVMKKIDPTYDVTPDELNPQTLTVPLPETAGPNGTSAVKPKTSLLRRVLHNITKGLGVIIPGLLLMAIHLGTATVSSAHTFVAQTAGAAVQAATQLVTGSAAQQVAMSVTLGDWTSGGENTLSGIAVNILKAMHPHAKLSSQDIHNLVQQIAKQNHIANPNIVGQGQTLDLGSFNPDVAQRLQAHYDPAMVGAHHGTSHAAAVHVVPQASVPAKPLQAPPAVNHSVAGTHAAPAAPIQAPPHASISASPPAGHMPGAPSPAAPHINPHVAPAQGPGNRMLGNLHHAGDSLSHTFHFLWQWTWSSPEHYLPVIAGLIAVVAILWILNRKGALPTNGSPFKPFSVNGNVKHLQTRRAMLQRGPLLIALVALGKLLLPYLLLVPSMLPHPNAAWAIPAGVLLLAWFVFTRNRWRPMMAVPLLLLASLFGLERFNIPEKTGTTISGKIKNLKNADELAVNTGVSGQPVRYEVPWTPGPHSGGVVSSVKKSISPGDLMVAMDPLDGPLASRARTANAAFFKIYGIYLIDPGLINAVTQPRNAFVHIKPTYETSFDKSFSDWLDAIELILKNHQMEVAKARGNVKALGTYVLSDEGRVQYFRLRSLGAIAGSVLSAREELNVPCKPGQRPQFVPGTGTITVGTRVREGESTPLFTQALPEEDLRQIKMIPRDARILVNQWHKNPTGTTLQLKSKTDGKVIDIPLSDIEAPVGPDDPTFGKETADESIFGEMYSNPAIGASATIPISVIIRRPGRTLEGQEADLETAYDFMGIYEGNVRLTGAPPSLMTVGVISVSLPPATQPPQHAMLGPLEKQIKAIEAQIAGFDAIDEEVAAFQKDHSEFGQEPIMLTQFEITRGELQSKLDGLRRERDEILAAGVHGSRNNIQPRDAFRHEHYPLVNPVPTASLDEGFVEWGEPVLTQISFYANPEDLPGNNRIKVRIPGNDQFVEFKAHGGIWSQDRTRGLKRYRAEAELPLALARQFFPPHQPFTTSWAEVELNHTRSILETIRDWWKGVPSATAVATPARVGPSRLKGSELLSALGWVAAVAFAVFVFGIDSHYLLAPIGGYAFAVLFHEFAGHGLSALIHVKRPTRLRPVAGNLEWQVQNADGSWETLLNRKVQKAGRVASWFVIWLGPALLFTQVLFGFHVVAPMLVIYAVLASFVFRNADQNITASNEDAADLADLADLDIAKPLPRVTSRSINVPVVSMSRERLSKLRDSLRDTVLENERYWYKGQEKTYLTLWQKIWDVGILRKKRVKLTLGKVLYRRFARDNVSSRQASLLANYWDLIAKEGIAGAKTRTFLWVILSLIVSGIYLFWSGPDAIRDFILIFKANPMFLIAFDARNVPGTIFVIILGLWITLAALESLGKLFATSKWNFEYMKQKFFHRLLISPEQRFHEKTGYEARTVLDEMDKLRILMAPDPGTGRLRRGNNEYDEFLDDLQDFARLATSRALLVLDRDPPEQPSEESLAFESAFRIQVTRSRSSASPIYRGPPVALASEATLKAQVKREHSDFDTLDEEEQYRLLNNERVIEAKQLARLYPMHALIALLRSGNTDLLTDLDSIDGGGLVLQILEQLKERLNTLDADAYDDLRAQERFHDFFDTLHYVYAGLCRPITTTAERERRDSLLEFLHGAVTPMEEESWKTLILKLKSTIPDSLNPGEPIPDNFTLSLEERDSNLANLVRGISYVLTARLLKEDEAAALRQLQDLRDQIPHTRRDVSQDRYLRDNSGHGTTSVVQLKMAYQKYFDLLSEFSTRFQGIRIMGKENIYVTLENTVNFRQTLREIALLLQMTDGTIYLINAAETQNHYADRLEHAIAERFSWKERGRIQVRSIAVWNIWSDKKLFFGWKRLPKPGAFLRMLRGELFTKHMQNDKNGIILSSATPLEWRNARQNLGAKVQGTSPLLKLGLFAGLIPKLNPKDFALVCQEARHYIAVKYRNLRIRKETLTKLTERSKDLQKIALSVTESRKIEHLSTWAWLHQLGQKAPLPGQAVSLSSARRELSEVETEITSLMGELDDLTYLEYEIRNVRNFLPLIKLGLIELDNNEPPPTDKGQPIFVPDDPNNPTYVLKWQVYVGPNEYNPNQGNGKHPLPRAMRTGA